MGALIDYHPVIHLPADYQVLDLSIPPERRDPITAKYTIGRYNEVRVGVYEQALFEGTRNIHMGIDIGAPAGTQVHAFDAGVIWAIGDNAADGDYGPTVITRHPWEGGFIFALPGHLARGCLVQWSAGDTFNAGQALAQLGGPDVNGGWPPHLHFQLSHRAPHDADLPGVVSAVDRAQALLDFPDPRCVLGPIYP
ncbi:MAG: peptidoglycan DD-metalloendopeptidase family protein [Rhodobacterales bacterium]|nr:peptidoglycan DD-metalloendopeptidase family protein [Rhodobacterales bacterium]